MERICASVARDLTVKSAVASEVAGVSLLGCLGTVPPSDGHPHAIIGYRGDGNSCEPKPHIDQRFPRRHVLALMPSRQRAHALAVRGLQSQTASVSTGVTVDWSNVTV
jgi:hypothetical protein